MRSIRHLHLAVPAFLAAALLLSAVPAARAQEETEHEDEFSYVPGAKNGPENWGNIKKEWAECGKGQMQSPIDLSDQHVSPMPHLGYLNYSYRPTEAYIVNRGHDIMIRFEVGAGSLSINGTAYYLRQLHWHSPTEHAVNGRRYDMELHMVHESAKNKAAVIGVLYKIGSKDPFLHKLEPFIKKIADSKDREEKVGVVDPMGAIGMAGAYYRYMGSLTTPPCTEGVIWTIVDGVRPVSGYQLKLLREAVHDDMKDNARPLQEVNNRDIGIFRPNPHQYY